MLPYGDRAWLVECAGDPVAVADALRSTAWPDGGRPEVVVGARTCLVRFHERTPSPEFVQRAVLAASTPSATARAEPAELRLRVRYDGPDLAAVAEATGLAVDAVIRLHSGALFQVAFLGFAPGFGYLDGLPQRLRLPRRAVPRTAVPAGSVAIADRYTAVYPRPSPGGWHLIGSCDALLFDPDRDPPSLLRPGQRVRFEPV